MIESALVKYQNLLVSVSRGGPDTVDFNWNEIWDFRKKKGKEFDPENLSMVHVHPGGLLRYTDMDLKVMKSYAVTFGCPILFSIVCFNTPVIGDLEHKKISYRYRNGKAVREWAERLRYVDLQILKELSYGIAAADCIKEDQDIRTGGRRLQPAGPAGQAVSGHGIRGDRLRQGGGQEHRNASLFP